MSRSEGSEVPNGFGWRLERVGNKGGSSAGAWDTPLSGTDLAMEQELTKGRSGTVATHKPTTNWNGRETEGE